MNNSEVPKNPEVDNEQMNMEKGREGADHKMTRREFIKGMGFAAGAGAAGVVGGIGMEKR